MEDALRSRVATVWPAIGFTGTVPSKIIPVIVPLSRLGAEQGMSTSSVFIGYFVDEADVWLPSRPLIVKIGRSDLLRRELASGEDWPTSLLDGTQGAFAVPFHVYEAETDTVLVAPFSGYNILEKSRERHRWSLEIRDIWSILHDGEADNSKDQIESDLFRVIHELYGTMQIVHTRGRKHCEREQFVYEDEYRWYMRGLDDPSSTNCRFSDELFGVGSETSMFGETWVNPRIVLEAIKKREFTGAVGAVHGDLHPKNVVLDRRGQVRVIDFGWATSRGHIVRDFVLMEINLRAMTSRSQVPLDQILAASRVLNENDFQSNADLNMVIEKDARLQLVRDAIRKPLQENGYVDNWLDEYLIPLFIVSYGLIKHLDRARCQQALLGLVLTTANAVFQGIAS
ncbi:phosphotransferase [Gordonia westfalica]|uniref:Phosphotransferase n=1 Tax=Gordonia westfalica TaxID=158898 RepID=A0ABU2GVJ0_9ACTN|nr:phosphotransferase [Gordonia westfalica]MDS1115494.1 phosphotransferase [Gordonia westfalica]